MTTVQAEKIARRKLSLLQFARELGNVSKACRILGYSRPALSMRSAATSRSTAPRGCRAQADTWLEITVRVRLNPILSNV